MTDRIFTDANGRKYINNEPRLHSPQRPAEPVQEPGQRPVAWEQFHEHMGGPFYRAPPQRKPLTEEEIWALYYALPSDDFERSDRIDFVRAIEAAHGIK